ncbi:MAG TPA: carboxypeptidase-like regulatory domain-containing protein [Bryobacteraceae bacterium]|nr:carboxypeptidase-like regulatory domain-containing protein [Bryobacteraceae bacterium]
MRIILALTLAITGASCLHSFQSPAAAATNRGAIQGQVLQSKSGEPVKKVLVIIRRGQEPGTGALTDASGAFRFDGLEPGPYTLSAERNGFILEPEFVRRVVNVKPAPDESEVTLKLLRTGTISGRVLDGDGEPLLGASVQVVSVNQKKDAISSFNAVTNDRGEYRAFNIPPGKYRIAVSYQPGFQQRQVRMQRPRTQSGIAREETYAITYYPAALDSKLAQIIDVEAGADLQGYDLQILRANGVNVSGKVGVAGGAPAAAIVFVTLTPNARTIGFRAYDSIIQDSNGAFELTQVLPGTYVLAATAPLGDKRLSAHQVVDVGSADLEGIQLTLAPPQTVSGVIVPPEGYKMPPGLIVALAPRENRSDGGGGMSQPGNNGAFHIQDVAPGDYDVVLASSGPQDDLYVRAIQAGDDDALVSGVHVGLQSGGLLKIILKANGGTVQASVKDSQGKPLPDCFVRLVPDAPRRAQMALYGECKTDASGACRLIGMAPGSYRAFAFAEERQIDFRDTAATTDIEDLGKTVSLAEGDRQAIELTPVPEHE